MSSDSAIGFWSYARDDNELDNGLILELARLIQDEFNLITGEPLKLFIDRDSVAWGEAWRQRTDSALSQTTFFIPIVTPRYFLRPECRRELLEFAAKASSLGVAEFLLPILYSKPSDFTQDNPDKAVSLIAGIQCVDWQDLRLTDPRSSDFRKSINELAKRLWRISTDVAERQLHDEVSAPDGSIGGGDGIAELVTRIVELIPDWLDAVEGDKVVSAQIRSTWNACMARIIKLRNSHSPASAVLSAQIRAAKELLPILERDRRASKIYLERSIQLDPLISALARLLSEHPDNYELIMPIREAIDEALENIHAGEERRKAAMAAGDTHTIQDHMDDWKHLGRVFQQCSAMINDNIRMAGEGNEIIRRWDVELGRSLSAS